jgi:hypothetical protein
VRHKRLCLTPTALALAAMALAGAAQGAPSDPTQSFAMCGEGGTTSFPPDRLPPRHRHDCPSGCHAFCDRKRSGLTKRGKD